MNLPDIPFGAWIALLFALAGLIIAWVGWKAR